MVLHLPAAPHDIATAGVKDAVAGASRHVHGLQDVDVVPLHLAVSDQETGRRQAGQTAAHQIGVLLVHALGLFRAGKGLIVALGIVNALAVFLLLSQLGVPVLLLGLELALLGRLLLLGEKHRRACASQSGCGSGEGCNLLSIHRG